MTPTSTNLASAPAEAMRAEAARPRLIASRWREYAMEGALLGAFMLSACLFGVIYEFPGSPVRQAISSDALRRVLMGLSMGSTAIAIVYSPWGKQSGAHINPAVTLTFLHLGKIQARDAFFYIAAQSTGATVAVWSMQLFLRLQLSHPAVNYVTTVPGETGLGIALAAEITISFLMMTAILSVSNSKSLSRYTGLFAGALVATYISLESPLSGMSMNPARSFGSALPSGIWTGFWIYLAAPLLGMLAAGRLYVWRKGLSGVRCAKLHHDNPKRCIFCGANGGFDL